MLRRGFKILNPSIAIKLNRKVIVRSNSHSTPTKAVKGCIEKYALSKFSGYIRSCQDALAKKFPKTMGVYRLFSYGTKDFLVEAKNYVVIRQKVNSSGLSCLSLRELETYYQMPRDILVSMPIVALLFFPFTNYIVLPLMYLFPQQLATSHFWTLQQRIEFSVKKHAKLLTHYESVFRHLQKGTDNIKSPGLKSDWNRTMALLSSGAHPSVSLLNRCVSLYENESCFGLKRLSHAHVKDLLRMHNMHVGWRRRKRLEKLAEVIRAMDAVITKEGGIRKLSMEHVRKACLIRGLNPSNVSTDNIQQFMDTWMQISRQTNSKNYSLLLHAPLLLAYNQPSNRILLEK